MQRLLRLISVLVIAVGVVLGLTIAAFQISPWPSVLITRHVFDGASKAAMAALAPFVPAGLHEIRDISYLPAEPDLRLDVAMPATNAPPQGWPVVVWVHGGAWVSGRKELVGNYVRLLAAQGYATLNVDYRPAPTARHPEPARQVNAALGWLVANARANGLDAARVVLAGDSAGAQIAAQTGIAQVDPAYARALGLSASLPAGALKGLLLFCGGYDARQVNPNGAFGGFVNAVMWAYFGRKDFAAAPDFALFSIPQNLPANLPPLFLSAGNADPLGPQSVALAQAARAKRIAVDALFFPPDHAPPLGHEYQFDLASPAGQLALDRASAFLQRVFSPAVP